MPSADRPFHHDRLFMQFPRSSGVLLHITSLPGRYGVGDLGPGAVEFVDFLEKAGQSLWQVLPLGPPALGNSPYSCYSAFAGNPLLISPEQMVADRWLEQADVESLSQPQQDPTRVNFEAIPESKFELLRKAFERSKQPLAGCEPFEAFCRENAFWLTDFARFESLMRHFGESNWTQWPEELVRRDSEAIAKMDAELGDSIQFSKFVQFVFDQQWKRIKQLANDRGIRVFGDMPIFVAHESADVWANQSLFSLNDSGEPSLVAGVPPDYFSETGQRWGNPLYRWDVLQSTGYDWWIQRFRYALRHFDLLRVDHFRGFESYWEIPAAEETALGGRWQKGPMSAPFDAAREALGELPIIAEDLGLITEEVHHLREQLGFPAMRVLQFGFDDESDTFHRPGHYPQHTVAYTGTHDNDTIMGWYARRLLEQPDNQLLAPFLTGDEAVHLQLIKAVLDSASDMAVIPMQDLLGLGNDARMNLPGEPDGNWAWRAQASDLSDELASKLAALTQAANR
ncbi:MAG: 4-alpha-glucanotransferase [Rubripirellula sp.]